MFRGFVAAPVVAQEGAQVMETHAASDDQDTLVPQGRQCPADFEMGFGIEIMLYGELHDRNLRVRVDQEEGDENAVIEAACLILIAL